MYGGKTNHEKNFFKKHCDTIYFIFTLLLVISILWLTISIIDMNKREINYLNERVTELENKINK